MIKHFIVVEGVVKDSGEIEFELNHRIGYYHLDGAVALCSAGNFLKMSELSGQEQEDDAKFLVTLAKKLDIGYD